MFEQSAKEASDKLEGQETNARSEVFERPEPFRAKFRNGTPPRSASGGLQHDTAVPARPAASSGRASLASSVEIEVTGLRPVKRNAPAFFGERAPAVGDESAPRFAERPVGPTTAPSGGESPVSTATRPSAPYPEAAVPHFTDEEFDDWAELETGASAPEAPRSSYPTHRAEERGHRSRPLLPTSHHEQRVTAGRPRGRGTTDSNEAPHRRRGSEQTAQPPARDHNDDRRFPRKQQYQQNGRAEGYTTGRHPRHVKAASGEPRPPRTARNSAELVDTTAERLYGNVSGATSRTVLHRHEGAARHRSQPRMRR